MTEESTSRTAQSSPPWEDALIVALRDLQCIQKNETAAIAMRRCTDAPTADHSASMQRRLDDLPKPPPLLAKLDGKAESATGDVLTSVQQRFFLFEMKASKSNLSSEEGKFIYDFLEFLDPEIVEDRELLELSRRGHHVLYPLVNGTGSGAKRGFLPVHEVTLTTRRYYDAVIPSSHHLLKLSLYSNHEIVAADLLWKEQALGLKAYEMAAYLGTLVAARTDGTSNYPLKCVIAGPDGFFWPCGDLASFMEFAKYFDNGTRYSATAYVRYRTLKTRLTQSAMRFRNQTLSHTPPRQDDDSLGQRP